MKTTTALAVLLGLGTATAFAQSPAARLDFFFQRSPSWDERFNLYPVYRTAESL